MLGWESILVSKFLAMKTTTTFISLPFIGIIFLLIFLLPSCAVKNNHYYIPPEGNVLTLTERHDLKVSATTSLNDDGISNFHIGYSPIKHLGLFGSWMRQKNGNEIYPFEALSFENSNSATYKSLAVGGYLFKKRDTYYSTMIPKKYFEQGGFLFDLYLGVGEGEMRKNYTTIRSYFDLDYQKIFGQAGLHYKFRSFGLSYIFKLGQMNVSRILVHGNFFLFPKDFFDELKVDNTIETYESTIRFEYGIRQAKLNLNLTFFSDQPDILTPLRSYYSLGVLMNVDEFFKKRKDRK